MRSGEARLSGEQLKDAVFALMEGTLTVTDAVISEESLFSTIAFKGIARHQQTGAVLEATAEVHFDPTRGKMLTISFQGGSEILDRARIDRYGLEDVIQRAQNIAKEYFKDGGEYRKVK